MAGLVDEPRVVLSLLLFLCYRDRQNCGRYPGPFGLAYSTPGK